MLLDDVLTILAEAGLGQVGEDMFKTKLPPDPDAAVAVYEYPGLDPAYVFGGVLPSEERPRIQLQVRDADYDAAALRIERCARALGAVRERVINGTHYHRLSPLATVAVLDDGEQDRPRLARNFECAKSVSLLPV